VHWDGSAWKPSATGTVSTLLHVWGRSSTEVWAVGAEGTAVTWNGTGWSTSATSSYEPLLGLGGNAADIWAAGASGVLLHH
jgi:hypothetical protein